VLISAVSVVVDSPPRPLSFSLNTLSLSKSLTIDEPKSVTLSARF
jgi:hypothetical protein